MMSRQAQRRRQQARAAPALVRRRLQVPGRVPCPSLARAPARRRALQSCRAASGLRAACWAGRPRTGRREARTFSSTRVRVRLVHGSAAVLAGCAKLVHAWLLPNGLLQASAATPPRLSTRHPCIARRRPVAVPVPPQPAYAAEPLWVLRRLPARHHCQGPLQCQGRLLAAAVAAAACHSCSARPRFHRHIQSHCYSLLDPFLHFVVRRCWSWRGWFRTRPAGGACACWATCRSPPPSSCVKWTWAVRRGLQLRLSFPS